MKQMGKDASMEARPFLAEVRGIVYGPHFWAIAGIMIALCFIYSRWPWTESLLWLRELALFEFRVRLFGSLFIIPLLYATLAFGWRGTIVVWLIAIPVVSRQMILYSAHFVSFIPNMAFLLFPLLIVGLLTIELRHLRRERKASVELASQRQYYVSQVLKAQENERRRIAQELHDDVIQTILVIAKRANGMISKIGNGTQLSPIEDAEWIRNMALGLSENIRRQCLNLRPSILDDIGLIAALRWLASDMNKDEDIDIRVIVEGEERRLPPETEVTLFRIAQEALNNVKRHSKATIAEVIFEFTPKVIRLRVKDNGVGFSFEEMKHTPGRRDMFGILGIQERAKFLNSTAEIFSKLGKGTEVAIEIKCEHS